MVSAAVPPRPEPGCAVGVGRPGGVPLPSGLPRFSAPLPCGALKLTSTAVCADIRLQWAEAVFRVAFNNPKMPQCMTAMHLFNEGRPVLKSEMKGLGRGKSARPCLPEAIDLMEVLLGLSWVGHGVGAERWRQPLPIPAVGGRRVALLSRAGAPRGAIGWWAVPGTILWGHRLTG